MRLNTFVVTALSYGAFWAGSGACEATIAGKMTRDEYDRVMRVAAALSAQRNYAEASKLLEGFMTQVIREGEPEWESKTLGFLGSVYQRAGRFAESEEVLNRSINRWTQLRGSQSSSLVSPLANLGALYYEAGQFTRAEKLLVRALDLQLAARDAEPMMTAMLFTNLGSVYFSQHKDDLAQLRAEQALTRFSVLDMTLPSTGEGNARNYALLGAVSLRLGDTGQAESCLLKALSIWETITGAQDPRRAEAVGNLAIYYSAQGSYEKAEGFFKQAQVVFQDEGGNNSYMRHFLTEYRGVEEKLGHKKEARQLSKKLQEVINVSAASTISRNVVDVNSLSRPSR
jgi:tetratricopeptide (TPR) repeat protein